MQRGYQLTGSYACQICFAASTGNAVRCVAPVGAPSVVENFATKSSRNLIWWRAMRALLGGAIARQSERFRKIACLSGYRAELASGRARSVATEWILCCGASVACLGRHVGARTWPAFVVDERFGRVPRHVWRALTRPLAVPIGKDCLGTHLPRTARLFCFLP